MEIRPSPLGDERGEQEKAYNIKRHLPRGTWIIVCCTAGQIVKHCDSDFATTKDAKTYGGTSTHRSSCRAVAAFKRSCFAC